MSGLFLLAPLLLLATVAILGFVGCTKELEPFDVGESTDTTTGDDGEPRQPYAAAVIGDVPFAYWRLVDVDLASHARDEIGPPPDGNHFGFFDETAGLDPTAPSINASDPAVKSVSFAGGYVAIEVAEKPELVLTDFTIEALVVADWDHDKGDPPALRVVVSSLDENAGSGWAVYASDDDAWQGEVRHLGTQYLTPKTQIQLGSGLTDHLALTFDGSKGELRLFVNAQPYSSAAMHMPNSTQPICIGAGAPGYPALHPFKGRIQEVALYDVPLTPEQIQVHVASNAAISNL